MFQNRLSQGAAWLSGNRSAFSSALHPARGLDSKPPI